MVYSNVWTGAVQSTYTYDTDGKRVRTLINNTETWFIYGMDGELLAEYGQGQTPVLPTKEYGYRNGELLIVAEAPTSYELVVRHTGKCADVVYMWTHDGAHLVQYDCWGGANQHFSIEPVGGGYYKIIAQHSGRALSIENNASHGGRVVQWSYYGGLNQQWSVEATDSGYVRLIARHSGEVMEIAGGPGATQNGAELIQWGWWGGSSQQWQLRGVGNSSTVKWLINDHLGTPRMIADGTGSLAGITRRDYLPYGEELTTQGGRSASQGYRSDSTRQGFTGYEHDAETGLEFAQARYFASTQGRFTSVDPLLASGVKVNPKTWNRYTYALNNPLRLSDPTGLRACSDASCWGNDEDDWLRDDLFEGDDPEMQRSPQESNENNETRTNGNSADMDADDKLSELFTEGKGFVIGASAWRNLIRGDTHFRFADGTVHTLHIYGNEAATVRTGIYIPSAFSEIKFEGGGTVSATNPKTGEVIGIAHVNISSKKQLERNLRRKPNAAGSRYIGEIGGIGAPRKGNWHAHLTFYPDAASRTSVKNYKDVNGFAGEINTKVHTGLVNDFRALIQRR